jgi:hypothetical protein
MGFTAFVCMVINYEVELVGELPKERALLNMIILLTSSKVTFFRTLQ